MLANPGLSSVLALQLGDVVDRKSAPCDGRDQLKSA
jgi:hypothetical protein